MQKFSNLSDYRFWRQNQSKIAFVPTMGNLHEGHLSLVKTAQKFSDTVVVSIFVNPLQFAPHEDFDSYPRTLAADLQKLENLNVNAVFLPSSDCLYPNGTEQQTTVKVPQFDKPLCGKSRPHFFSGVATVVCKLFNLIRPDYAIFGEKDYQQFLIIKKMTRDLNFPIEIIASPIVRENSGLAMSSRNNYLSSKGRLQAASLYESLLSIAENIQLGQNITSFFEQTWLNLQNEGFKMDYLDLRDEETLLPLQEITPRSRLFIAAEFENTRLIDNLSLSYRFLNQNSA